MEYRVDAGAVLRVPTLKSRIELQQKNPTSLLHRMKAAIKIIINVYIIISNKSLGTAVTMFCYGHANIYWLGKVD